MGGKECAFRCQTCVQNLIESMIENKSDRNGKGLLLYPAKITIRTIWQLVFLLSFSITYFECAPYSLPEKKSYAQDEDPYTYYVHSMEAYQKKEYELALKNINQAILLNKDMARFYQLKGDIYRAQFLYTQAIASYELALARRSNFIEVQEAIAEIYLEQNNYDEAIRAYKKVTGLDPERTDVLLKIADCYLLWNEVEVAQYHLDNYEKTVVQLHQPLTDSYYEIRAEAFYRQKKYQESLAALDQIKTPVRRALRLLGLDYYALGDYERGVGYFNKLLKLDKDEGEWYYYRGIYFFQKDDLNDAKNQFLMAQKLDSTLTEVAYYLGKISLQEGDEAAARQQFGIYQKSGLDETKRNEIEAYLIPQKIE